MARSARNSHQPSSATSKTRWACLSRQEDGMMKSVLCYGDSLTWGYDPEGSGRHLFEDRWPSVLAAALGPQVNVIAEGLNGRTTGYEARKSTRLNSSP